MAVQLAEKLLFDRAKLLKISISNLNYSPFAQPFPKSHIDDTSYLIQSEKSVVVCATAYCRLPLVSTQVGWAGFSHNVAAFDSPAQRAG